MKYFIILISLLILSALFILLKERTLDERKFESPVFFDMNSEDHNAEQKKAGVKKGILIFDISGFSVFALSDSLVTPGLAAIRERSVCYEKTFNLSPRRMTSLKSFIECVPPYKIFDGKEPYLKYKKMIADSLRNSSIAEVYEDAGYSVKYFSSDTILFKETEKYFSKSFLAGSKKEMIETIYREISTDSATEFIYFADSGNDGDDVNYLKKTDSMIGELVRRTEEVLGIEPLCLFISTLPEKTYSGCLTFFYRKGIEPSSDTTNVSLTDIAKTLLNLTQVRYPNYFGGYDIDDPDAGNLREYFAGSVEDTLLLFNENFVYKSVKYSPEYKYYDLKRRTDATGENLRINEKYEDNMSKYFGGDYIKYIILKNNSEKPKEFKFNLRSRRRFEELSSLSKYYVQTMKNYRYTKDISRLVEPGASDTVMIYYASIYQEFSFRSDSKYSISYGAAGINAGYTDNFDENSYYGLKFGKENVTAFQDYDIRIFNLRVNY